MTIDLINNLLLAPLYWSLLGTAVLVLIGRSRNTSAHTLHSLIFITIVGVLLVPLSRWYLPVVEWSILPEMSADLLAFPVLPVASSSTLAMVLWAYATGAMLIWLAICYQLFSAYLLLAKGRVLYVVEHQQMLEVLAARLQVKRPVGLRYSCKLTAPVTLGYWRPYILLPVDSRSWSQEMSKDFPN